MEKKPSHPVLFDLLSSLPLEQQRADAVELFFGPYDPFVTTVTTGVFHIIQNPGIEEKLLKVLREVPANEDGAFRVMDLEKVDYLVCTAFPILDGSLLTKIRRPV